MRREILLRVILLSLTGCCRFTSHCGWAIAQEREVERGELRLLEQRELLEEEGVLEPPDWELLYTLSLGTIAPDSIGFSLLEKAKIIDPFERAVLLSYIEREGAITSSTQLYSIDGLEHNRVKEFLPFLTFTKRRSPPFRGEFLYRSSLVPHLKRGYSPITLEQYNKNPNSRYLGSSLHYNFQFLLGKEGHYRAVVTLEKDSGERSIDFFSWGVQFQKLSFCKRLTLGSYSVRKGEGLLLWNGISFGGAVEPLESFRADYQTTPYRSCDENLALKGVAITFGKREFELELLLSHRAVDARVVEEGYTSLLKTGLHNTPSTVGSKGALKQSSVALSVSYNSPNWRVGALLLALNESLPYGGKDLYRQESFEKWGSYKGNIGLNWRGSLSSLILFGEVGVDHLGRVGQVSGAVLKGRNSTLYSITTHYKERGLSTPLSSRTFKGGANNFTVTLSTSRKFGYQQKLTHSLLFNGSELSSTLLWWGGEQNWGNIKLYNNLNLNRFLFRGDYRKSVGRGVELFSRVQLAGAFNRGGGSGLNIHQEALFSNRRKSFTLVVRGGYFNSSSWVCRLYSYERDMLYQFTTALLYGEAINGYLQLVVKPIKKVALRFKYGATYYFDRSQIGTGSESIEGSLKSELKWQLQFKL